MDKEKSCCFFGHRRIDETEELKNRLCGIVENLIVNEKVDTFFFGSKSQFDDLCHKIVTELKEKYPHIKRIYVRSAFQHIPDWYEDSLLNHYEDTYFPEHMEKAGKASYFVWSSPFHAGSSDKHFRSSADRYSVSLPE